MVKMLRRALTGFLLMPGRQKAEGRELALRGEVIYRACGLRGYSEKTEMARLLFLPGREESAVLRGLREVVVEHDSAPTKGACSDGLNLVVFRGVFGSGGYGVEVRSLRQEGWELLIECDFENPGGGLRTTAGFTQPIAILPLPDLSPGRYCARLHAREYCRSAQSMREVCAPREAGRVSFKVTI